MCGSQQKNRSIKLCSKVYVTGLCLGGEQILPWGSLCERTPLGKVVGNLAQAKTGSTQDPLVLKLFCNEFVPLCFNRCDKLRKILVVK